MVNTKSYYYSYGKGLTELAKQADELAAEHGITIIFTCQYTELARLSEITENLVVAAQYMDHIDEGPGMGHVLPEAIYEAGARAVVLNHAERPLLSSALSKTIDKARSLGIKTIVAADSVTDARAFAVMNPDIILTEPTELIGTGVTSDDDYILDTIKAIKEVNEDIFVMQGAGISSADDVYHSLDLGADGNGVTSGIVANEKPLEVLEEMVLATKKFL
jgi:triosephosphate isomerase